ncbi:MAG: recombination regulator RecX [Lachnospiraceae bacterium]|nr:recombination regulator RecX [Lachnospiraceae bacterium]
MTITKIEPYKKGKVLVYLNDEPSFVLYSYEVKQYQLTEDMLLDDGVYTKILDEVLIKRAKSRTLHLLDRQDRTEKQLRAKLKENMYPDEAIDAAVEAATRGNFLNDERYACQYVRDKSRTKSKKVVEMELAGRGISKELIAKAFAEFEEEEEENSDLILIEKLIRKKCPDISLIDITEKQKLFRYLAGKGFVSSDIRKALERLT